MQYNPRKILAFALVPVVLMSYAAFSGCNGDNSNDNKYTMAEATATPEPSPTPKPSPTPIDWRAYIVDRGVVVREQLILHEKEGRSGNYSFVIRRPNGTEKVYHEKAKDKQDTDPYRLDTLLNVGDTAEIYVFDKDLRDNNELAQYLFDAGAVDLGDTYTVYVAKVPEPSQ